MMSQFRIVIVSPPGWQHAGCFFEIAETLVHGLRRLGYAADATINGASSQMTNIFLGAQALPAGAAVTLPPGSIIYNLEQITPEILESNPAYADLMQSHEVWDYSACNIAKLEGIAKRISHVPIGYDPALARIPKLARQDIDVLFYGSMSDRRAQVLEAFPKAGLVMAHLPGVYGAQRDMTIARSKIVLNLHHSEEHSVFEVVRVSYALANRKAVVGEVGPLTSIEPDIEQAIAAVPYAELTDACISLARDDVRRAELERKGHEIFARRDIAAILRRVLPDRASSNPVRATASA